MGEKIVIGPINKGLRNDRLPFVIDNDSFPTLINAYQWRGRLKRKRGTQLLNRLRRYFNSANPSYGSTSSFTLTLGVGNLFSAFSLQANGNIVPNSVTLTDSTAGNTYTDDGSGNLIGVPGGTGSINYDTGSITISGGASHTINAVSFLYYPDLPVMGLRDLVSSSMAFPGTMGFDTRYSYNIVTASPYNIYDVSFYKNPTTATYVGYTQKTNVTPTSWNGLTYQQFWTTNYLGALWATNGITEPFTATNIGMQFKPIVTVTVIAGGPPATATLQITGHGLVVGDFVFVNEVATTTGINFQTGYVITVTDANNVIVEFPNATIATNGAGGIAQYLTNRSDPTKDCLRWYDGDPTDGNPTTPTLNGHKGWVNFMPPISEGTFSVGDLPLAQYYLIGARMIVNFKDRLLFFGPVVQSSSLGPFYLQDTVIYSQNGTPYYTSSFTGDPVAATTVFHPILVPDSQTATAPAYFGDVSGFGGFVSVGIDEQINSVSSNEDVLIVGLTRHQTKLVYTGNDIIPFNFFLINSELGSGSTFSTINTDQGVLSKGSRGYLITSQVSTERIDLPIPDEVFQTRLSDNGTERVTAVRDFINEWVYFTYPVNYNDYVYPTQTLLFNYRENTWAIFREAYTTYGLFRRQSGETWATLKYNNWMEWTDPWNAGESTLLNPEVIAGNQQGFVLFKSEGAGESNSLYIQNISGSTVTSPDHCLNNGDYIIITGCLGTVASSVNGKIFSIRVIDDNSFMLNPNIGSGLTYGGLGVIKRMYVPYIQSKQFPTGWELGRKTRLGPQQYLLSTTSNGQITLLIFLSQNSDNSYNAPEFPEPSGIVPQISSNNTLIYSTVLYTCPENTNLGLTPANINLQMPTAVQQQQIWHRMNTSLLGDTVQIGFSLSDSQMRDTTLSNQFAEIEIHACILDVNPSSLLA